MTGLISKQDAINAVSEYALKNTDLDADKLNGLVKVIMKLSEPQRWIPVSERLPDYEKDVLICDKDGYIYIGCLCSPVYTDIYTVWIYDEHICHSADEVKAWMPLPEPFEAFDGAMNPQEE